MSVIWGMFLIVKLILHEDITDSDLLLLGMFYIGDCAPKKGDAK